MDKRRMKGEVLFKVIGKDGRVKEVKKVNTVDKGPTVSADYVGGIDNNMSAIKGIILCGDTSSDDVCNTIIASNMTLGSGASDVTFNFPASGDGATHGTSGTTGAYFEVIWTYTNSSGSTQNIGKALLVGTNCDSTNGLSQSCCITFSYVVQSFTLEDGDKLQVDWKITYS